MTKRANTPAPAVSDPLSPRSRGERAGVRGVRRHAHRVALAALLLAPPAALAHPLVPGKAPDRPIVLRGGDLYTISHGILAATDLRIEGGKIAAIGPGLPTDGAEVVELGGARVYPGLIAASTQLGLVEIGAVRATRDQQEVGDLTPEVIAHTAYNPDSELLPTIRSHGVTTVESTPAGRLLRGRSSILHLDGWTKDDAGVLLDAGLHLAWPAVAVRGGGEGRRQSPEEQKERMAQDHTALRDFFRQARAYADARAARPDAVVDLRFEAMRAVLAGEKPLFVHADDVRQIREAVAFAVEQKVRMVLVDGGEADAATALLIEHQIPVLIGGTLVVPDREDDPIDRRYALPARLHQAGVRFALADPGTTDVRNLPFHAGHAVAYGLPADVALRSITLSAAEILGIADRQGSLDIGKDATLFVSTGDVLDPLTQKVTHMWIAGRPVDLDDRHEALYRKYAEKVGRSGR